MRTLLGVLLLAAACTHADPAKSSRPVIGSRPGDPITAEGAPVIASTQDTEQPPAATHETVDGRRRGTPHFGTITGVVVDASGTMAVTRDALGGVRVWPSLDGKREPQRLPVTSAAAMAIAARADGSLVAVIDANGVTSLLRLDPDGLVRSNASLAPDVPLTGLVVLPDGERVVALRSDQRLLLLDERGAELGRIAVRGARVVAIHAGGDAAYAVLRKGGDTPSFEIRKLTVADDKLAWDGDALAMRLPLAKLPHTITAVSPDGGLFAWIAADPQKGNLLQMIQLSDGSAIEIDGDLVPSAPATTLGAFTSNAQFEMGGQGGNAWRVEIAGGKAVGYSMAMPSGTSPPAFGGALSLTGYHAHLVVRDAKGNVQYLGYDDLSPSTGVLAADGQSAAWISATGAVIVQRFDGRADVRIKGPNDWFGSAAIVDDAHVLAARNDGALVLYDSTTGKEVASMLVSQSTPWFLWNPQTKLIALLHDAGVVWVMNIDPASDTPLGAPVAIGDGAQTFTLLDPDKTGAVVATVDASMTMRKYTEAELKKGISAKDMKRDREQMGAQTWYFDRLGRGYVQTGDGVEIRKGSKVVKTIKTGGASLIAAAPNGERLAIVDSTMALHAYSDDGSELWALPPLRNFPALTWSEDGTRALVVTPGSAVILDGMTGSKLLVSSGWGFGRTTRLPQAFPINQAPIFEE